MNRRFAIACTLLLVASPWAASAQQDAEPDVLAGRVPADFRIPPLARVLVAATTNDPPATDPMLWAGLETPAASRLGAPTLADLGGGLTAVDAVGGSDAVTRLLGAGAVRAGGIDLRFLDDLSQLAPLGDALGVAGDLDLGAVLGVADPDDLIGFVDEPLPVDLEPLPTLPGLPGFPP